MQLQNELQVAYVQEFYQVQLALDVALPNDKDPCILYPTPFYSCCAAHRPDSSESWLQTVRDKCFGGFQLIH